MKENTLKNKKTKKNLGEIFIKKAQEIHKNEDGTPKYDYSKVEYKNCKEKVQIICPIHGEFWQTPDNHINQKEGCPECAKIAIGEKHKLTEYEFIEKANKIHQGKNYTYKNFHNPTGYVTVVCPIHGEFKQLISSHLIGCGCPKCGIVKNKESKQYTDKYIIRKAKEIHKDKYDYSLVNYKEQAPYIKIICSIHGEFMQLAYSHINGIGCPKCAKNHKYTKEEFIKKHKRYTRMKMVLRNMIIVRLILKICQQK